VRVLILATDIYTRGGIARYTGTLADALGRLLGPENVDLLPLLGGAPDNLDASSVRIFEPTSARLTLRAKIRHAARVVACARSRYDLVICSHLGLAPVAALIRSRYATPYLVVCHGSEAWARLPVAKRAALRGARALLAVSAYTARALAQANRIPETRVKLVYNAIPDELVRRLGSGNGESGGAAAALHGPSRILLSVGSLGPEHAYKGVDTVIAALPRILAAVPAARYVVAGGGAHRASLERLATSLNVGDRVTFAGEVTDAELANLYCACDVFVLPSRASMNGRCEGEGFGRVYVEAALAAKPVVGSREGGAAEAVLDGRTGLLVDPRSVRDVADAAVRLLKAPQWAEALGAEGQRWALGHFTMPAMVRALGEILSVIGSRFPVVSGPSLVVRRQLLIGSNPSSVISAGPVCEIPATNLDYELQSTSGVLTDNRRLTTDIPDDLCD
jgi:phosphatidylinositol alpha-1,6-mannosyltransferase